MEAEKNKSSIFREKSMERISSPEDLNDYVRVASPGVWLVLAAIVVLLAGFVVWGVYGNIEMKVPALVVNEAGTAACYVREVDSVILTDGMPVRLSDGTEAALAVSGGRSLSADDTLTEYARHVGGFSDDEWVVSFHVEGDLPEGAFSAEVITEAIKPISFIFNKQ